MSRTLYIDGFPSGSRLGEVRILISKEDIADMVDRYSSLQYPPDLFLDCRALSDWSFNSLLKFIEEYKASMTVIAKDPVPPPILSRFSKTEKYFTPEKGVSLIELRFKLLPNNLKSKVMQLFGINKEVKDDHREAQA